MSAHFFALEAQREIIVCPDCGQVYDPAKAAALPRVQSYSPGRGVREIKPQRVAAQDVRTSAHRAGRHHQAHAIATQRALDGWAVVAADVAPLAIAHGLPVEQEQVDRATTLRFVATRELASLAVEIEAPSLRAEVERIERAARAVREDHPWWRAYLHELGAEPEEIARGIVVNGPNRGDLFFAHTRRAVVAGPAPTLRGLT